MGQMLSPFLATTTPGIPPDPWLSTQVQAGSTESVSRVPS
jgi:hypothetical protein